MESKCWLWPDHAIGKRESRELREEHNSVVNVNAELLWCIRDVLNCDGDLDSMEFDRYRKAIARAEGR